MRNKYIIPSGTVETIIERRSIREYDITREIDESLIQQILYSAMYAPSFENRQPWHFLVVNYKHIIDIIKKEFLDYFHFNTKTLIVVCTDTLKGDRKGWWVQDCAAATQNIILSAASLGLASNWYGLHPIKHRKEKLKKIMHLPKSVQPFSLVTLGFSINSKEKQVPNRYDEKKVHFNHW